MATQINFGASKDEIRKILEVQTRASKLGHVKDTISFHMDITACHLNGCKLDFDKLMDFDDFSFIHDVVGIQNNINRITGKLDNCFVPRCAAAQPQKRFVGEVWKSGSVWNIQMPKGIDTRKTKKAAMAVAEVLVNSGKTA